MQRWLRWILVAGSVHLVFSCGAAWGTVRWVDKHTTHFDVPLMQGARLHVHLGSRFMQRYHATFPESAKPRALLAALPISISYRTGPQLIGRELAAFALPTWPLPAATILCYLLLAASWPAMACLRNEARHAIT